MKSDTLLDYAVFQLSPKNSRCELFVSSDGKTEKLASGLVKPFVAHLKVVEEQVALSVESIKLEVERSRNAKRWFTKGTVERFVRFVSTPEILDLVNTLDAEMSQLEAAQKLYSQGAISQLSSTGGSASGVIAGSDATKKELLRAIDVRLSAVKQDYITALHGAASAGFNEQTVSELQMFSDHFSARRLNEACNKFLSLCEKRQDLISIYKAGLNDQAIRCSYGSDMSIDEEPTTPEQKPSRSNPHGDGYSGNACQAAETIQTSLNQHAKASSKAVPLQQSRESSVEKEDRNNGSESLADKEKDGSVADKADSVPKGQLLRRLSVQERIHLFENKQKETSGSGGKPVANSVELKRLPSDVQEKAVLRRWSGASDMSIDLGGDKKDTESPLCTPSYASASQTKSEDRKGLQISDSTSSNKPDFKETPRSVIASDLKLQSLAGSTKNGEAISGEKQSTISSSKSRGVFEGVQSISYTSTAESDAWTDQSSLNTRSKFSVNLAGNYKDKANLGEQFRPSLGADIENFGLASQGKFKGFTSDNEPTKIRGRESYEGSQDTYKKQSEASRIKGDDIKYTVDFQHAGTSEVCSELRSQASSGSQFEGSEKDSPSSHSKWRCLVGSDEALKKDLSSLKLESSSGSTIEDFKSQKLKFGTQVSDPEQLKRGQGCSAETDSAFGNRESVLSSKVAAQDPWANNSFSMQSTSLGQREKQAKENQDLNDELKVKANELEKLFAEHKLRVPGESNSTRRNRIPDMASESVATSSYQALVIDADPVQLPSKHSMHDPAAGGFSYAVIDADPVQLPLKLFENKKSGDDLSNHFSECTSTEGSRGKHYETYMQKRNDKLRYDWSSRREEKESKIKAMQDSLERSAAEMKAKILDPTNRMDSVFTARRRADRLRSINTRTNIGTEQTRLDFGQSDDDEYLGNSEERKYSQDRYCNDENLSRSATNKKIFPSKIPSSITPRTTPASIPKSANKSANIASGRRKLQSENPLAQSVPNFSELRKENTKPSTAGTKINRPSRSYVRSKSTHEEVSALKEEKTRRSQSVRKSFANQGDLREIFSGKPEGAELDEPKIDNETKQNPYGRSQKHTEAKPFLRKGNGKDLSIRTGVAKQKVSMEPDNLKTEKEFADVGTKLETPADYLNDDGDEELVKTVNEGHVSVCNSEPRLSQESEKWVSSDSENDNIVRSFSYVDPSLAAELPANVPDSAGGSPVSWKSRTHHPTAYTHETSDIDVSADSPMGSPVSWNSHSLSQADSDAARMRKKWGAAQKPMLVTSSSNHQSRKDMTKGFKRLLKFGRKTRGTENLVDWISATTSEGDDDTEDFRDPANRLSEDLRKSRMGLPPDGSFNENDFCSEQVQSMQSSIPTPPQNFKLKDDHLSGSSIKDEFAAPKSFFSLSTFRSKGSDSKAR